MVITVDSLGMNGSNASSPAIANTTSHSHGSSRWLCSNAVMSPRNSDMRTLATHRPMRLLGERGPVGGR